MEVAIAGCLEVKVWADTVKFTDVIVARLRKCSDLIREGKVFIENKTKVASAVGCSERALLYFRQLLFKSNKKIRRSSNKQIARSISHFGIFCRQVVENTINLRM